jgi:hypothetical protein
MSSEIFDVAEGNNDLHSFGCRNDDHETEVNNLILSHYSWKASVRHQILVQNVVVAAFFLRRANLFFDSLAGKELFRKSHRRGYQPEVGCHGILVNEKLQNRHLSKLRCPSAPEIFSEMSRYFSTTYAV